MDDIDDEFVPSGGKRREERELVPVEIIVDGRPLTEPEFQHLLPHGFPEDDQSRKRRDVRCLLAAVTKLSEKKERVPLLARLSQFGLLRPAFIDAMEWEESIPVTAEERMITFAAAVGNTSQEIADELGIANHRVKQILGYRRVYDKINDIHVTHFKKSPQAHMARLLDALPTAIETTVEILNNKMERGSTRLAAAVEIMDRTMGKAPQTIITKDATIVDLLREIEKVAQGERQKIEAKTVDMTQEGQECEGSEKPMTVESWIQKEL